MNVRHAARGLHAFHRSANRRSRGCEPAVVASQGPRTPGTLPASPKEGTARVSALIWWVIPIAVTALVIVVVALRGKVAEPRVDPMADRLRLARGNGAPHPAPAPGQHASVTTLRTWAGGLVARVRGMSQRARTLLVSAVALAVLVTVALVLPVPYVKLAPGPTFNVIGENDGSPFIVHRRHHHVSR